MAYISREINLKLMTELFAAVKFQRLSLRSVKGISVSILFCTILGFLLFWQPAYFKLRALQQEKTYWQNVLKTGVINTNSEAMASSIPTMDQLPDLIERCRSTFLQQGVDVVALNVERFGERRETGKGASLDYSLVRMHFSGNWENIITSLEALEAIPMGKIQLQEVVLDAEGGEALLQIYFGTGL